MRHVCASFPTPTVRKLPRGFFRLLVATVAVYGGLASAVAAAEPADYLGPAAKSRPIRGDAPPGVIGQSRLAGRGSVACYFQPVALLGPEGVRFSLPQGETFLEPQANLQAGLLVGGVYRFQITDIPGNEGAELFPTIELIDRTYPPPGLATRFPIQIHLNQEDLIAALQGQMVTRVVYLEDPQTAIPLVQTPHTAQPLDIPEYQDALEVADRFGRPVAIVRIGSMAPPREPELMPQFFFGYPNWAPIYPPEPANP